MAKVVNEPALEDADDVPSEILKRVQRGEAAIKGEEPRWHEALAFFGNDQFVQINAVSGNLDRLETREGGQKPSHRPRLQRNRMTSKVMGAASLLTGRIPNFGVAPPNGDPAADNQAQLSEKFLQAMKKKLYLQEVALNTTIYAILTGAGFTWPYWDPTTGAYVGDSAEGRKLHQGDIAATVLHQGEVLWEPGCTFRESPWICVRKAQPVDVVKASAEINGDRVKADARAGLWERPGNDMGKLVKVYEYLEYPSPGSPGRWLRFAGKNQLRKEKPYPRKSGAPCLHKLPWIPRPDRHRDLGAGEQLVDCQRSYNRGHNAVIQWRTLALVPQVMAPEGSLVRGLTDRAGEVIEYRLFGNAKPEFRQVMEIPATLFETMDRALEDMDDILASNEAPSNIESGSGIQTWNESAMNRQGAFVRSATTYWEDFGQHLLELGQAGYTEKRLLDLDGKFGPDRIPDFLGRDMGQLGRVTVSADDLKPRTRAEQEKRIMFYAERMWITQYEAMRALDAGTADAIISEIELDEAKQQREIRRVEMLAQQMTGEVRDATVAGIVAAADEGRLENDAELPMPMEIDNHEVHRHVLRLWMKTRDFERQHPLVQEWAQAHDQAHSDAIAQAQAEELAQRQQQATALGDANSARQPSTGQPSRPAEDTTGSNAGVA